MDQLTTITAAFCPTCGSADATPNADESALVCPCGETFTP